jgi:hypothetical protein
LRTKSLSRRAAATSKGVEILVYEITANVRGRFRRQVHETAAMAKVWADTFREKGACDVLIKEDGNVISAADLPRLIAEEIAADQASQSAGKL